MKTSSRGPRSEGTQEPPTLCYGWSGFLHTFSATGKATFGSLTLESLLIGEANAWEGGILPPVFLVPAVGAHAWITVTTS